jgi:Flp pilus assembly protein TadD
MPEDPVISDTLGWIYCKKGLGAMAVPLLQQSVERDPSNPGYHYHLGVAQEKAGDHSGARASLEKALQLGPTFDKAADARAALAAINK